MIGFRRLVALLLLPISALGQEQKPGHIHGRVVDGDGRGVAGVTVMLDDLALTQITRAGGTFVFERVPPGTYSLSLALGERTRTLNGIVVVAGETTSADETVDWPAGLQETVSVVSASRRLERIVGAPAAVSSLSSKEIERKASNGQLPKLLEFAPGVELTQSGVYDFNLNTRGFNSSLTRRVATLIDGRDASVPFLGSQEWSALTFPLDDIDQLEFLRGPSAALYGANASSGVLNVITKAPRHSEGGLLRITAGELSTSNADARWARGLGAGVWIKLVGGIRRSGDFTVSRDGSAEYSVPCTSTRRTDCLPQEVVPLARRRDDIAFGGLRVDKYLGGEMVLTAEAGYSYVAGPVLQTGAGRAQALDVRRPWARANWSGPRFNMLAYYSARDGRRQLVLGSGRSDLRLDERDYRVEGQTNWGFAQGRVRVVAGASAGGTSIDSADRETGRQTLLFEPVDSNHESLFGQVDWQVTDAVRLVAAAREDWSTLHTAQFSPKAGLVYAFTPAHSLRLTYNRAFQVPNYAEFFLQSDAAPPADLAGLNAACAPFGVDCGFGATRVLVVGNEALAVERLATWEIGYTGVLAGRALVTAEYYRTRADDFITDLLPQLGTALGRINPAFGPWIAPAGLPAPVADAIRTQVPLLTTNFDGSDVLAVASYTNFGVVDTQGVDLAVRSSLPRGFDVSLTYSWFDFEIQEQLSGLDNLLLPNSPAHRVSAGIGYSHGRLDASASLRWVEGFRWAVGSSVGDVPSYVSVDVVANWALARRWKLGVNIANALDERHWESFGGDVLRRRALASLTFEW